MEMIAQVILLIASHIKTGESGMIFAFFFKQVVIVIVGLNLSYPKKRNYKIIKIVFLCFKTKIYKLVLLYAMKRTRITDR